MLKQLQALDHDASRWPETLGPLLTLGFVGWALAGHAQGLRELSISARGWWWLVTGLGLSWLSLVVNALAWKVLVAWLGHGSGPVPLVPLYLSSNLLKYLPGGGLLAACAGAGALHRHGAGAGFCVAGAHADGRRSRAVVAGGRMAERVGSAGAAARAFVACPLERASAVSPRAQSAEAAQSG